MCELDLLRVEGLLGAAETAGEGTNFTILMSRYYDSTEDDPYRECGVLSGAEIRAV